MTCGAPIRDRSGRDLGYACNLTRGHLGKHACTVTFGMDVGIGPGPVPATNRWRRLEARLCDFPGCRGQADQERNGALACAIHADFESKLGWVGPSPPRESVVGFEGSKPKRSDLVDDQKWEKTGRRMVVSSTEFEKPPCK